MSRFSEQVHEDDFFCDKPKKPWIIVLSLLLVAIVGWGVLQGDHLLFGAVDATAAQTQPLVAVPVQPLIASPIQNIPVNSPLLRNQNNGSFQQVAMRQVAGMNNGMQSNMQPVAIQGATKQQGHIGLQNALKDAVNTALPSVVDIHAMWVQQNTPTTPTNPQDPQFVKPFDGTIDKFIDNQGFENIGAGTFFDARGYILTNYHVVKNARNIRVTVPGKIDRDYVAEFIAHDPTRDLALIKIQAGSRIPPARFGNSDALQTADFVIAIGSPFGMHQTVTSGIVSGIRKSTRIDGVRYDHLIQTDAPINRGSSGGPMVNMDGEVIGVNTAIYAPNGFFNGTGFAIPINDAKQFIGTQLGTNYGPQQAKFPLFGQFFGNNQTAQAMAPTKPVQFGVEGLTMDSIMARQLNAPLSEGVVINRVIDNSPAAIGGLQRGDVIISLANTPIQRTQDIPMILPTFKAGDVVDVIILRNGQTITRKIELI
ncbi:MAG: serine protease Do [Candidatus Omnitrophota bacterium]|jgi:serine protease Do